MPAKKTAKSRPTELQLARARVIAAAEAKLQIALHVLGQVKEDIYSLRLIAYRTGENTEATPPFSAVFSARKAINKIREQLA
jgi:hypothetical protein